MKKEKILMQYELCLKKNRDCVDLREFAAAITMAILMYLPGAKVEVREKYYQIELEGEMPRRAAILIGRMISFTVPKLRALVKEYPSKNGKHRCARKLFRRRKKVILNG